MRQLIKLSKEFDQCINGTKNLESTLIIRVMYDQKIECVDYIYSVEVLDHFTGKTVDISRAMENFEDQLNDMIDSIDWTQVYAEQANEPDEIDDVYHTNETLKALGL